MASRALSGSFESTGNRRSACDRCRNLKLRCERHPDAPQCRRCLKRNSECITGTALKSGRPLQVESVRRQQQRRAQEDGQDYEQAQLALPTPPPTTFSTPPETIPTNNDGDLAMQLSMGPGDFNGLEPVPTVGFDQNTTVISSAQRLLSAGVTRTNGQASSGLPANIHVKPLTKLADLQANLLVDIDLVKHCRSAEKCPPPDSKAGPVSDHNFVVGRMFEHAKTLVEIMDCFVPLPIPAQPSLTTNGADSSPPTHLGQINCDVPTMLALFSCYVCIVRIYRTIISSVHDSVPFLMSVHPHPQLFPGINLGGFNLEARIDLQVQILVQVSEDLLSKIEARFGLAKYSSEANHFAYQQDGPAKILQMMLDEEASEQPPLHEMRGHCEPLPKILANLKRMAQDGYAPKKS